MMTSIYNLFRRNLPAKLLALFAAVVMWVYVMDEVNPVINARYTVPIEVLNAPEGYNVTMDIQKVTVKVRGKRDMIASLGESDFKAIVDLAGNTEGDYEEEVQVMVPSGFELIDTSAGIVHVSMESLIAHGVPVEINISGKPAQGMEVADIQPVQQYVNVYGPRHLVDSVTKATGKIKLTDNNSDFTMRVNMSAVSADGDVVSNLTIIPNELDVTVHLISGEGKKLVPIKPAITGILPEGYTLGEVSVQPALAELTGANKALTDIAKVDLQTISLQGITSSVDRDVDIVMPDGVTSNVKKARLHIEINSK